MIVKASIFVGKLPKCLQLELQSLAKKDIEELTHVKLDQEKPYERDGDLLTFNIVVDPNSPSYAGEAFVKEDFIYALLEVTGIRPV